NQGTVYRNASNQRSVDVQFQALIEDADSDNHLYQWDFGDGEMSQDPVPTHTFIVEDDHAYSVLLQVQDESGNLGQARTEIIVDVGETSFPLTLNFVGDIMIARRYEDAGGIIETGGVASIFEPTLDILGNNADLSIANLECTMTLEGIEHPTKSVSYKGKPEYTLGIAEAGIDLVSLANNHTLDYGLTGLQTTQQTLMSNNILYSGSGVDSDEAYQPVFTNTKGVTIAWCANSDRTGQYNNYQPYLHAANSKPGFAYLSPYYLLQQINAVQDVADLVVMEMHAGSEYSYSPGAGYDRHQFGSWLPVDDWIAPTEIIDHMDQPGESNEDENFSPLLDVPHMWDREIRHYAIDSGADLVVVHHPHIIQGFEVYNGGLIAHSLGNFIFDLNYHETFPSVVLNAEVDASGFSAFSVNPVFLDDYIPVPATGTLGLHLLDYLAKKSRDLNTYLYVDRDNITASVWLDTLAMPRTPIQNRRPLNLEPVGANWISQPVDVHRLGNLSALSTSTGTDWQFRLGRELLWYGNMEEEGATQWNVNSTDEWYDLTQAHSGERSIGQHRSASSGDNVITNLENRIRLDASKAHHLAGYIKVQNANNVTIEVRYYASRTSSSILATHNLSAGINGTQDWSYFHKETIPPAMATHFDIRLNTDVPTIGESYAWFDDVQFIEWSDWEAA
ncbi:CapA family protein, partial [bacterium]|nr:CapA family protein [bacterium]